MRIFVLFAFLLLPFSTILAEDTETTPAPAEPTATESVAEAPVEATAEPAIEDADAAAAAAEPETPKAPTFVVLVPERIDHDWYWMLYSDRSQHIVQSAIEKALIRAGMEVIDLATVQGLPTVGGDLAAVQTLNYALSVGRKVNADYVVSGMATAVKSSEGTAYNVNVVRTQAEINAKIIRTRDGKVMAVEDASAHEGGQSGQAAGQNALKKAGSKIGSQLAQEARKILADSVKATP